MTVQFADKLSRAEIECAAEGLQQRKRTGVDVAAEVPHGQPQTPPHAGVKAERTNWEEDLCLQLY